MPASRYLCLMVQQVLIALVFLAAVGYVVTLVVRSFRNREGCATGCGKCEAQVSAIKPRP